MRFQRAVEGGVSDFYRALHMAILRIRIREGWKRPWKFSA